MKAHLVKGCELPNPALAILALHNAFAHVQSDELNSTDRDKFESRCISALYWLSRFGIELSPEGNTIDRVVGFLRAPQKNQQFAKLRERFPNWKCDAQTIVRCCSDTLWLGAADSCCELACRIRYLNQIAEIIPYENKRDAVGFRNQYSEICRKVKLYDDLIGCSIENLGLSSPDLVDWNFPSPADLDQISILDAEIRIFGYSTNETHAWANFCHQLEDLHAKGVTRFRESIHTEILKRNEVPVGWEPLRDDDARPIYPEAPIRKIHDLQNWLQLWLVCVQDAHGRRFPRPDRYFDDACRELRNTRKSLRSWKIRLPTGFDDTPPDIHAAERQLELILDFLEHLRRNPHGSPGPARTLRTISKPGRLAPSAI